MRIPKSERCAPDSAWKQMIYCTQCKCWTVHEIKTWGSRIARQCTVCKAIGSAQKCALPIDIP